MSVILATKTSLFYSKISSANFTQTNFMPLAILFHFLCGQHVSDINIPIIRSLRLFCWTTTLVVLFLVRCVLEFRCGWVGVVSVLQAEACNTDTISDQEHTTNVVIQQNSRKLLMMDILISETCWSHKKWNKIASDIKLVFYSSTITIMYGPLNIRWIILDFKLSPCSIDDEYSFGYFPGVL